MTLTREERTQLVRLLLIAADNTTSRPTAELADHWIDRLA